ncbi:MAG: hypothetical protein KFH98_04430 [Gemmatimonadetes bacterium]|nr:hypothetical protein [Gemmatimonadota bacterium]
MRRVRRAKRSGTPAPWGRRLGVALLLVATGGCTGDRERPGSPTGPGGTANLRASILTPATGATVLTGNDIVVLVEARDVSALYLQGVGFVARRAAGAAVVDSVAVFFPQRSDTTHAFTLRLPNSFSTNTQVDIYGIAFGPAGAVRLSPPIHVVAVQCTGGTCP